MKRKDELSIDLTPALEAAMALRQERGSFAGIGTEREKSVHAALKFWEDPDPTHQEIPLLGHVADIFDGEQVVEIQSAGLYRLKSKLEDFLVEYPVKVVYPIPHRKTLVWIDPESGEEMARNVSHHIGSYYLAFRELYGILPFLKREGLTVELLLVDMEEYKLLDGWSRDKKRGAHKQDRIPLRIAGIRRLSRAEDYRAFVPFDADTPFTAKELCDAVHFHRKGHSASTILRVLREMGVVEPVGKKGRAILWQVRESDEA